MPASTLSLLVDTLTPREIDHGNPPKSPNDAEYAWHFIAEGDSWFSMGAIPSSNLLADMRLPRWAQVLNIAYPGDVIQKIGDIAKNAFFDKYVVQRNFNYPFSGLLLSGGGNDLIDAASSIIRKTPLDGQPADDPHSYLNSDPLSALMTGIVGGYRHIHDAWNSPTSKSAGKPIFVHTYDYATPRNAPALFAGAAHLSGPWLYPVLRDTQLPIGLQQRIADTLFDTLASTLLSLDGTHGTRPLANVHVIDTRNTLVRANPAEVGNSNDWLNEIHPNAGGYRKIAARLSEEIALVLGS